MKKTHLFLFVLSASALVSCANNASSQSTQNSSEDKLSSASISSSSELVSSSEDETSSISSSCVGVSSSEERTSSTSIPSSSELVSSSEDETSSEAPYKTVKSYLKALSGLHNYTLKVKASNSASTLTNTTITKFEDDSFFYSFKDDSYGYIKSDDGVYQIQPYDDDRMIGGELYTDESGNPIKDLWNGEFFYSFADLDLPLLEEKIDDGEGEIAISGKKNRLAILRLLGLDSSYYASIFSFTASINDTSDLVIVCKLNDSVNSSTITLKGTVYDINSTHSDEIEDFLIDGTYYTIEEDFAKARDLMKGNNYTHYYYDDDGEKVGTEIFNEDYYFITWDSTYVKESGQLLTNQGMIGLDHKQDAEGRQYDGSYLLMLNGSTINMYSGQPYNEDSNVANVYHYPSLLTVWSNVELFDALTSAYNGLDNAYATSNSYLMSNFVSNFSLDSMVSSVKLTRLVIGWTNVFADGEDSQKVVFTLETSGGNLSYEFTDFGSTSIKALDELLGTFTDY
jgi:hypothetical protein